MLPRVLRLSGRSSWPPSPELGRRARDPNAIGRPILAANEAHQPVLPFFEKSLEGSRVGHPYFEIATSARTCGLGLRIGLQSSDLPRCRATAGNPPWWTTGVPVATWGTHSSTSRLFSAKEAKIPREDAIVQQIMARPHIVAGCTASRCCLQGYTSTPTRQRSSITQEQERVIHVICTPFPSMFGGITV